MSWGAETEPEAPVQERGHLLGGETQLVGSQLEQLTVPAQRSQRKGRLPPGREHELERGRCVFDEPGDALEAAPPESRSKSSRIRVISSRSSSSLTRRGSTTWTRDSAPASSARRQADPRAGPAKRLDHIRPQHHGVVVVLVYRQPRHRPPRRLHLAPRRQQGRLPVTRRACHQGDRHSRPAPEPLRAPPRNRLVPQRRRSQARREQDRPQGRPPPCRPSTQLFQA